MKTRPIHENLDSSFVNLSALIKFLRRRQFIGNVRVEMENYEADITFAADNQLRVREYDRRAGRISEGEESLQRLLIRAREPNGIINVYEEIGAGASVFEKPVPTAGEIPTVEEIKRLENAALVYEKAAGADVSSAITINPGKPHRNGHSKNAPTDLPSAEKTFSAAPAVLPKAPLEFSNSFEDRARQSTLAPPDWQMLLNITAELLKTVDRTLAEANLEFAAAFEKARLEVAGDYPFLNPAAKVFDYQNGKIVVRRQINAKIFAAGINETLRRILEKLGRNPKLLNVHLATVEKIILLIEKRQSLYDKFHITPRLAATVKI